MSRKPEDSGGPTVGEMKSFPASLQQAAAAAAATNQTQAQQANTAGQKGSTSKRKVLFSAALCTHLGINIGVKGPTAFELFMVYRALGGRKRR